MYGFWGWPRLSPQNETLTIRMDIGIELHRGNWHFPAVKQNWWEPYKFDGLSHYLHLSLTQILVIQEMLTKPATLLYTVKSTSLIIGLPGKDCTHCKISPWQSIQRKKSKATKNLKGTFCTNEQSILDQSNQPSKDNVKQWRHMMQISAG